MPVYHDRRIHPRWLLDCDAQCITDYAVSRKPQPALVPSSCPTPTNSTRPQYNGYLPNFQALFLTAPVDILTFLEPRLDSNFNRL